MKPADIKKLGVALSFVPEDRLGMGLVGSMGMTGNMMLRGYNEGRGIFANRKEPTELADRRPAAGVHTERQHSGQPSFRR